VLNLAFDRYGKCDLELERPAFSHLKLSQHPTNEQGEAGMHGGGACQHAWKFHPSIEPSAKVARRWFSIERRKVTGLTSSRDRRRALKSFPPHASLSSSCRLVTTVRTQTNQISLRRERAHGPLGGGGLCTGCDAVEVGLGEDSRLGHGGRDEQLSRAHVVEYRLKVPPLPAHHAHVRKRGQHDGQC